MERAVTAAGKKTGSKQKERKRMCLQGVGRSSGVEVGFLDVDMKGEGGAVGVLGVEETQE